MDWKLEEDVAIEDIEVGGGCGTVERSWQGSRVGQPVKGQIDQSFEGTTLAQLWRTNFERFERLLSASPLRRFSPPLSGPTSIVGSAST